jgi:hypothetical protein
VPATGAEFEPEVPGGANQNRPAVREDDAMNPREYEERYHNLVVSLDGPNTTTVDVHRYQNNDAKLKANEHLGNREALKKKDSVVGKLDAEVRQHRKAAGAKPDPKEVEAFLTPAEALIREVGPVRAKQILDEERKAAKAIVEAHRAVGKAVHLANVEVLRGVRDTLMGVHSGKGSPEEIAIALHLVARYKLYDKIYASDPAAGVRDYCDKYIGLDCNGFVGNYARATGRAKVPNTPIGSYAPDKVRRTRIEDVKADDVLVWPDNGHIAVIHSIDSLTTGSDGKPARDCVVVESTAGNPSGESKTKNGGLQHSTYSIRAVGKDKIFQVERPKGRGRSRVYIAPLS